MTANPFDRIFPELAAWQRRTNCPSRTIVSAYGVSLIAAKGLWPWFNTFANRQTGRTVYCFGLLHFAVLVSWPFSHLR